MYKITPKEGLILVNKHKLTKLTADISIEESDDDKDLITGEIMSGAHEGETAIFGKYALLRLTLKGENFYFLDEQDIVGYTNYSE